MKDLMPAGLTEDGTCLLLVTAAGERFLLPVDDQLQRLVGTARHQGPRPEPVTPDDAHDVSPPSPSPATAKPASRPHQQEPSMDSALRPRDIQTRIRGGESAEAVAAAAGTSVEAIMPFAGPVLAERAHQAQAALRASVRRTGGSGGARTLGDAVAQFLSARGLRDDDVAWDSWRRPDGRWALTAQVEVDGQEHRAELVHDLAGRYVVAENDDARLLTGEAGGAPGAGSAATPDAPRLTAVGSLDRTPDHLGDDAIELVRDRHEPTVLDAPARPQPETQPEPEPAVEPEPELETEPEPDTEPEPASEPAAQEGDGLEPAGDQGELDLGVPEASPEPAADDKPRRGRRGRASVPSWDEIMFGGGSDKG